MKIRITTDVKKDYLAVAAGFNLDLFKALAPPFPKVTVQRFDGCITGHQVWIQLNIFGFKQQWNAKIVEHGQTDAQWYFIDEGTTLPFPLRYWRHRHIIQKTDSGSIIIDDIEFRTPLKILDFLFYPLFWLQFAMRKPIYRKIFS